MNVDERLPSVLTERLCAALREAIVRNGYPIDPRTLGGLAKVEQWARGEAPDGELDAAVDELDTVAETFFPEVRDGGFHPDYQTANTAHQIADFAANWHPTHETDEGIRPLRLDAALEFLAGLCTQNDQRDDQPAVGLHLGIKHPPYTEDFDKEAVLRAATDHVHATMRRS